MKTNLDRMILFALMLLCMSCSKKENGGSDGKDSKVWYPEKSQPGVFKIPSALKNNTNTHAKRTYDGIKELEDLITLYHDYFLVPDGIQNTSVTPQLNHEYHYTKGNENIIYKYRDYSSDHRNFELFIKDAADIQTTVITGEFRENWNAEDGKPENGRHYGKIAYIKGSGDKETVKEFVWKDMGSKNYFVNFYVWKPGINAGLNHRYDFNFNADLSGDYSFTEWLPNGNFQYNSQWASNGSGSLMILGGPDAGTYTWN